MVAELLFAQAREVGQVNLGILYQTGNGIGQDYFEAAKWYRKSALQGNELAQYNLGLLYDAGAGVPKDSAEAVRWIRMAADRGHGPAQTNLGAKYATGDGIPKDLVEAHICFNLASVKGNPTAQRNMAMIERDMTPDQRAKAMELARTRFAAATKPEAATTPAQSPAAEPPTLTAAPSP